MAAYVDADLDLHRAVVTAAHNSVLSGVFASFSEALHLTLTNLTRDPDMGRAPHPAQVALAEAIRRRDAAAAAQATLDNLSDTQASLEQLVGRRG